MNCTDTTFAPNFSRALDHFRCLSNYSPTPLKLIRLSSNIVVQVKDETERMGLGAFKALGGPYAIARLLAEKWLLQTGETLTPKRFKDDDIQAFAAQYTFVTASAGNHGMGIAAGAKVFGANARIYLAKTVPSTFDARLEAYDAQIKRVGQTYEDSVAEAIADTKDTGAILVADGSWEGYTKIPKWVMEGYTVIAEELRIKFEALNNWPTHVYLQAGVGGLAAAMAHMIRQNWSVQPKLIVVEPEYAACLRNSHLAGDLMRADGPDSNMGRLDCKEPSIVAWHTLERCGVSYVTLTEEEGTIAAQAMTDLGIPTTPSGSAGYGALMKQLGQADSEENFCPLVIVTECLS